MQRGSPARICIASPFKFLLGQEEQGSLSKARVRQLFPRDSRIRLSSDEYNQL